MFDLKAQQVKPLLIEELEHITQPGICHIRDSHYLIIGGLKDDNMTILDICFYIDIKTKKIIRCPPLPVLRYDSYPILRNNTVLVVSGKMKDRLITNEFFSFSLSSLEWKTMPKIPNHVFGVTKIFLDHNKDLIVILSSRQMIKFDFSENCWKDLKYFTYNFDKIYITNESEFLLFNPYHNTLYEYNYFDDTIKLKQLLNEINVSNSFYIKKLDCAYYLNDVEKNFVIYNATKK